MARKLFPGAGYFLHLIDTYCSDEDTLRDALGELTFYYEFYTPPAQLHCARVETQREARTAGRCRTHQ